MKVSQVRFDGRNYFDEWLDTLDSQTEAIVLTQLARIEEGNLASLKSVGKGVYEIRINRPTKIRIYCGYESKEELLTILAGYEKAQSPDIKRAQSLWREYKRLKK